MPEIIPHSFTAYSFTEEERRRATVLPELTYKHIQTELAKNNEKVLAIEFDTLSKDPVRDYIGIVQYHKGFSDALALLLVTSDETKEELKQQLEEQRHSQNNS